MLMIIVPFTCMANPEDYGSKPNELVDGMRKETVSGRQKKIELGNGIKEQI
jgi:hypothetical protein